MTMTDDLPPPALTQVEAVRLLDAIDAGADPEAAHSLADSYLLEAASEDVARAYMRVMDRSPWWACA